MFIESRKMQKIIIIDPDQRLTALLEKHLSAAGYSVAAYSSGREGLEHMTDPELSLLILEHCLAGEDGFELLRTLRGQISLPLIVSSQYGGVLDAVVALELGADDFLRKPYDIRELTARIHALLRRCPLPPETRKIEQNKRDSIHFPGLVIDKKRYKLVLFGQEMDMPPKELELLFFLAAHPERVFTREQLMEQVWGYDFASNSRTIDVHIKRIRKKLSSCGEKTCCCIRTVWSVGYKFELLEHFELLEQEGNPDGDQS